MSNSKTLFHGHKYNELKVNFGKIRQPVYKVYLPVPVPTMVKELKIPTNKISSQQLHKSNNHIAVNKRNYWKRRPRYVSNYADAVFRGLG